MEHLNPSATEDQLRAFADSVSKAGATEMSRQTKSRTLNSVQFRDGDIVTIPAGYASLASYKNQGEEKENFYFSFESKIQHKDGSIDSKQISLRHLTTPTILVENPSGDFTRRDLIYRFGRQAITFKDVIASDGNIVSLPLVEKDITFTITVGTIWVPDYASWKDGSYHNAIQQDDYGYVKP